MLSSELFSPLLIHFTIIYLFVKLFNLIIYSNNIMFILIRQIVSIIRIILQLLLKLQSLQL
nr:MAG TPA: hypothetical protein [Bacteriophage sp.]